MYKDINQGCLAQYDRDVVDQIVHRAGEDSSKRIILTGHSMGAALAALAAYGLVTR